jgi:hypothetical protein
MSDDTTTAPFNWREHLKVHPAADLFPLMSETELKELAEDISKNGLQSPIMIWRSAPDGSDYLIDGRNRADALAMLGWLGPKRQRRHRERQWEYDACADPLAICFPEDAPHIPVDSVGSGFVSHFGLNNDDDVYRAVLALNVHRRHLTAEQKRELIDTLLKRQPEMSDRHIGNLVKADNKTVATRRAKLEGREEIPHVETRTDSKGRKQPAKRKSVSKESLDEKALQYFLDRSGLTLDALIAEIERTQPSDSGKPVDGMGLGPELMELVMKATGETEGCLPALRAVQHLVCTRPWRDVERTPELQQATLFDQADASAEKRKAEPRATTVPELQRQPESVVKETSKLHREVADFLCDFEPRLRSWSQLPLTNEAKDCMHDILMVAADQLMTWAQEIDGRGSAQIAEAA